MILVTVGMQLGFDRLVEAMDKIAPDLDMPIIAQTGKGDYSPRNMEARSKITPGDFEQMVEQSKLIVSHAGIGTVLTAARFGKPVLLMPRRAELGEHRNDHQLATVRNLRGRPGILVAMDEGELLERIREGLSLTDVFQAASPNAERLHSAVTSFIETGKI